MGSYYKKALFPSSHKNIIECSWLVVVLLRYFSASSNDIPSLQPPFLPLFLRGILQQCFTNWNHLLLLFSNNGNCFQRLIYSLTFSSQEHIPKMY